ncbi:MAG: DNA repair protein RecO [Candidatus Paceibacteria bacterium]
MLTLVLTKRDHRESDEIVTFLSKEKGKIQLLAKGTKKIKSKNSYLLEPFSFVDVQTARGKTWNRVTKVDGLEYFKELREDHNKGLIAGYSAKLVDKVLEEGEDTPGVFKLLLEWLSYLKNNPTNPFLLDAFVLQLISLVGFKPDLEPAEEVVGFSVSEGRFIESGAGSYLKCSKETAENLKSALSVDFSKPEHLEYDPKMHNIIYKFSNYHLGQKLPDWRKIID